MAQERAQGDPPATGARSGVGCPYVVGIGASAGGLQPLERFFESVNLGLGVAYVVVQHLSPNYRSLMPELLARHTKLRVHRVDGDVRLEPDCIYLTPPKTSAAMHDGVLRLQEQDLSPGHALPFPINDFLESLAAGYGDRAIGIILSGTGTDGTHGVRAVHEVGGLAMVQDPETAEFDGMPRSALSTGIVHYAQPPDVLARSVQEYVTHRLRRPVDPGAAAVRPSSIEEIVRLLSGDDGVDFSDYRESTIGRRVERRMFISGHSAIDDYVETLRHSAEERDALRKDLLISVTRFFRDAPAWHHLRETVLPQLIDQTSDSDHLRIWVTACSTGEEAYSLAIDVIEAMARAGRSLPVKIFATDVSRANIEKASEGVYTESIISDIPPRWLTRHFTKQDGAYRVSRQLRKLVVFAQHDLTRDAPFGRVNLALCRNVLIYMQPTLQRHVLANLHYALRSKGFLMLGAAENLGALEDEFEVIQAKWKIYRKRREVLVPLYPRSATNFRITDMGGISLRREKPRVPPSDAMLGRAMDSLLCDRDSAYLIVGESQQLLYVYGNGDDLLRVPTGKHTMDVTKLLVPELALPVSTAMQRARKSGDRIQYGQVPVQSAGDRHAVDIEVRHHKENRHATAFFSVLLRRNELSRAAAPQAFEANAAADQRAQELEQELERTRENLQATIEELETANEEQQSSNEELLASNEELQSTNEELQSVNEELHTVNAEYQQRIRELVDLNKDIDNLLRCTGLATVFLDSDLRIRKFTPAAREFFHFEDQDIGRAVTDLTHNLRHEGLAGDMRSVLTDGETRQLPLATTAGRHVLCRLHPYRGEDQRVEGVVLTLVDVTELQIAQLDLLESTAELERVYRLAAPYIPGEESPGRVLVVDRDETVVEGLRNMLASMEGAYAVQAASDIDEALRRLDEQRFDLVVLDPQMTDGHQRSVLKDKAEVPVIVLSEAVEPAIRQEANRTDLCGHVAWGSTDLGRSDLATRMARAIARSRAQHELRNKIDTLRSRIGDVGRTG